MGVCSRALFGACLIGISAIPLTVTAQDMTKGEESAQEFVGPLKEIPAQPTKADANFPPTYTKGQPAISRVKLEPNTNDAINEAITGDAEPVAAEVIQVAPPVNHEASRATFSKRSLVESSDLNAGKSRQIGMNRRALLLMRRSATLKSARVQQPAGSSPKANLRTGRTLNGPRKTAMRNMEFSNIAPANYVSATPMFETAPASQNQLASAPIDSAQAQTAPLNAAETTPNAQPDGMPGTADAANPGSNRANAESPASLHISRETGRVGTFAFAPAPPIDTWEKHFLDTAKRYQFTEQQVDAGERILDNLRTRASQYQLSRKTQIESAEKLTDKVMRDARLGELNRPIDGMFNELRIRLENLATLNQRHQAAGPAPKG